jgi:prolipoprotein diacylglyceryltransferase
MTFPVYFHAFGYRVHPHPVMEVIAYTGGFQLYMLLRRRRWPTEPMPFETNLWVIVGAIFGALVGSKLLAWIESAPDYWHALQTDHTLVPLLGGKTIVGGLLGGWAGVEVAKKLAGIRQSTGDAMVFPLIVGMAVGRVGCFLTGLSDHTCGNLTTVPWAIDFGDGPRHPAQLYDIAALGAIGFALALRAKRKFRSGELFRWFVAAYCVYRFAVEFLKPSWKPYVGLSAIQLACLAGAAMAIRSAVARADRRREKTGEELTPSIL